MWKKIRDFKEIKEIPVGTKIRINGEENVLTAHYGKSDYGFDVEKPTTISGHRTIGNRVSCDRYMKLEYWVKNDIWHPWLGGGCPETPGTDVEMMFYNGYKTRTTSPHYMDWEDVVAYRVIGSERDRVIKRAKEKCGVYINLQEALGKLYDAGMLVSREDGYTPEEFGCDC